METTTWLEADGSWRNLLSPNKKKKKRMGNTCRIEGRAPRSQAQIWQRKWREWTGKMRAPSSFHSKIPLLLIDVYFQIHLWGRQLHSRGRRWGTCPGSHTLAEQRRDKDLRPRSTGGFHPPQLALSVSHLRIICLLTFQKLFKKCILKCRKIIKGR